MPRLAIYPGSFDPLTNGHLSLIQRGLKIFDGLVVAVANNAAKKALFSLEERKQLIREAVGTDPRVEVDSFETLLVDYAKHRRIHTVLRGLRAVSDFEYEFQMVGMNMQLNSNIETVFLMARAEHQAIASRLVKEIASLGGDITHFVSPYVVKKVNAKMASRGVKVAKPK